MRRLNANIIKLFNVCTISWSNVINIKLCFLNVPKLFVLHVLNTWYVKHIVGTLMCEVYFMSILLMYYAKQQGQQLGEMLHVIFIVFIHCCSFTPSTHCACPLMQHYNKHSLCLSTTQTLHQTLTRFIHHSSTTPSIHYDYPPFKHYSKH